MQTFTLDQFRKYLESQDSMGDIFYNLSEENILKANEPVEEELDEDYNQFGGKNHPNQQVLESAAGYYIGDLYYDEEMKGYYPYSRDSQEYWRTREEAQLALDGNKWSPRIF